MAGVKDKLITAESLKYVSDHLEEKMSDVVEISNTEPTSDVNVVWIDPTSSEVEVAEMSDLEAVDEKVDELIVRVPVAPTTDGVYTLKVTVSNGSPTYAWISVS